MIHPELAAIVGQSEPMQRLRALIARVAPSPLPVLIEGETGVGKELVAQALHALGGRRGPFVAVNVCAISESMFEDTLFGHMRGAFTGATGDRRGLLAEAHEGTLFLDEIGGLPLGAQAKLLRALETRQYRPVGAGRDEASNFRLVAAVNEPLAALVAAGRFRQDLSFRLRAIALDVPPLRERASDIPVLAEHFALCARQSKGSTTLDASVRFTSRSLRRLREHPWPGNVRELRHAIERAVLLCEGSAVTHDDVAQALGSPLVLSSASTVDPRVMADREEACERRRLVEVLCRHRWDTGSAATELNVTRQTVYKRLRRFGIDLPDKYQRRAGRDAPDDSPRFAANLGDSPTNLGESLT